MMYQNFKRELKQGQEMCENTGSNQQNEEDAGRAGLRSRRFQGVLPSRMSFAPKPSYKTPKRARKK